jgi:tetratricopeptide (TPR) repeat protein
MKRTWVVLLLLVASARAQIDVGIRMRQVRVWVTFEGGGSCQPNVQVILTSLEGPGARAMANDQCEADFVDLSAGTYRVSVSGQAIAESDVGTIEVSPSGSGEFEVQLKRANHDDRKKAASGSGLVAASDLEIPSRAKKALDQAGELIEKRDFAKAMEKLNLAIRIYPAYAAAYNNLGVIYARLGDRGSEAQVLEKAISINDRYAPAYLNLGRLNLATGDFSAAEKALNQASSYDPNNAIPLVLLSYAEFMNRHFDEAIASCQKAHVTGASHAFVHQVAAHAYEQKHDAIQAASELQQFLKEEPSGPQANAARKELATLEEIIRRSRESITAAGAER